MSKRIACYGHDIRRDESHITRRTLVTNVEGYSGRSRPRKMVGLLER